MGMNNINPGILLVEDDHLMRSFVGMLLAKDGHTCKEVTNGAEALEYLKSRQESSELFAFVDVQMPVKDGPTFVTEAQEQGLLKNVKVFFLTNEPLPREVEFAGVKFPVLSKLSDIDLVLALANRRQ
jgi:CheY-like chemotaxis protein